MPKIENPEFNINKDVQFVKGVGPSKAELLKRLGINTIEDLLTYFPRDYQDRSNVKKIADLVDGETALIQGYPIGRVNEVRVRKNMLISKLIVEDDSRKNSNDLV